MAAELRIHWDRNDNGKDDDDKEKNCILKNQFKVYEKHSQESLTAHHTGLTLQANPWDKKEPT